MREVSFCGSGGLFLPMARSQGTPSPSVESSWNRQKKEIWMTMLGMIDYGLIVLFFIGVTALILVIAYAPAHEAASQAVPPPQKAKEAYTFLAVLFILLIVLAFFVWRGRSPAASM